MPPVIGSLIEPRQDSREDLYAADYVSLQPLIEQALNRRELNEDRKETAMAVQRDRACSSSLGGRIHFGGHQCSIFGTRPR